MVEFSCDKIPLRTKQKMAELIEKTARDGVERGFYILRDYSYSETITGDFEKVGFSAKKQKELSAIGTFHTHPPEFTPYKEYGLLSTGDIVSSFIVPVGAKCVGTLHEGEYLVRCYIFDVDHELFKADRERIINAYARSPLISVELVSEVIKHLPNYVKECEVKMPKRGTMSVMSNNEGFEKNEKYRKKLGEGNKMDEKLDKLRSAVKKLAESEEKRKREKKKKKRNEIEYISEIEELADWIAHNIVEQIERTIELRKSVEEEIEDKISTIIEAEISRFLVEKGIIEPKKVEYTPVVYTCPICGYTTTIYRGVCPKCGAVLERVG